MFDKHDCLWIMGKRENVLWQLHTVVAGVERAGAAACRSIDG